MNKPEQLVNSMNNEGSKYTENMQGDCIYIAHAQRNSRPLRAHRHVIKA